MFFQAVVLFLSFCIGFCQSNIPIKSHNLAKFVEKEYGLGDQDLVEALHKMLLERTQSHSQLEEEHKKKIDTHVEVPVMVDGSPMIFAVRDFDGVASDNVHNYAQEFCRAHHIDSSTDCAKSLVDGALTEHQKQNSVDRHIRNISSQGSNLQLQNEMINTSKCIQTTRHYRATGPIPLQTLPFFDEFTEFGEKFEDKFEDSRFGGTGDIVWEIDLVNNFLNQAREGIDLNHRAYPNAIPDFYEAFTRYPVNGLRVLVVGSEMPWIEVIAIAYKASIVVTSEYQNLISKSPLIQTVHAKDLLNGKFSKFREFDIICSFSSIEHDGLGRYGEPLDPRGDFAAMDEFKMLLKPGGLLFLGIPIGEGNGLISGNRHRIYGKKRFQALTHESRGWKLLDAIQTQHPVDENYVPINEGKANNNNNNSILGKVLWKGESWKNQPLFVLQSKLKK